MKHGWITRRGVLAASSLALCAALVGAVAPQSAESESESDALRKLAFPRTIVLVRHAEKALEPKEDPGLTEEGAARAKRLADMLAKSGVTHVFATEYQRTQQTVAPLSVAASVNVQLVPARAPDAQLSALDSLPRGSVAVVAGHSNTVPLLVEKLTGGQSKLKIEDSEYDRLFVVTQWGSGRDARLLELRY